MSTLRSIPAPVEALLGSDALAHVITTNSDGTPQVSVVWCGVREDEIQFCTEEATAKVRNIRREPRVVLSIEDEARNASGTQQHLVVRGRARVLGPADQDLCDELCRVHVGRADHPLNLSRSPTAVTVAVQVDRFGGNGPWVTS
ncbi:MAG: TIGR03618 family F420-dependent PPOX class oxidoreductase [Acidimicrobiales bacterium]|nr:TIGR03618 family F420-dependent PPOX class oxidoreductase [Acidimicrobiales bacterium]